jgi:hypothetical protein
MVFDDKDVDLVKANRIIIERFPIGGLVAKTCWCRNVENRDFPKRHCANFSGQGEPTSGIKHVAVALFNTNNDSPVVLDSWTALRNCATIVALGFLFRV